MAIIKYTPWSPFYSDDDFSDMESLQSFVKQAQIAVDVYETKDEVVVKAQLPGFKMENIKVTIEGSTLTIKADSKEENEDKINKKYWKKEIREQSIVRSITLPASVSSDKANAEFKNGILNLALPKAEEAKPKEIIINSTD